MKQGIFAKLGSCACAAALAVALTGCASPAANSATEAQQANRAYMSQVNETMVELDENLDLFVDAVSRGDVVNMRTQASNAYRSLDKLSELKVPDELKSVSESYASGASKLREALDAYIDLYTDLAKDEDAEAADYDARIAKIQALYDEGVAALQAGDKTAAGSDAAASSQMAAASSSAASAASDTPAPDATTGANESASDGGASGTSGDAASDGSAEGSQASSISSAVRRSAA